MFGELLVLILVVLPQMCKTFGQSRNTICPFLFFLQFFFFIFQPVVENIARYSKLEKFAQNIGFAYHWASPVRAACFLLLPVCYFSPYLSIVCMDVFKEANLCSLNIFLA